MKDLTVSELNDIYGGLLTPHKREMIKSYYDFDLSLAEIAENAGVSRQAVRDAIVSAEEQLRQFEAVLGVRARNEEIRNSLSAALNALKNGNAASAQEQLVAALDKIREQ